MERDVFSMEMLDLETPDFIKSIIDKVGSVGVELISLPVVSNPESCSLLVKESTSKMKYFGSYWRNIYRKLDNAKKDEINRKTEDIFQSATKVRRKLNPKSDIILIRQKERIRDCVTKNIYLAEKYGLKKITDEDKNIVEKCIKDSYIPVMDFTNQNINSAYGFFGKIMSQKIQVEEKSHIFEKILIAILQITAFWVINAALPIIKLGAEEMMPAFKKFTEKLKDEDYWGKSLTESILDTLSISHSIKEEIKRLPQQKSETTTYFSMNDYLIQKEFNLDFKNLTNLERGIVKTRAMLLGEFSHSSDEKRKIIIEKFNTDATNHFVKMKENASYFKLSQMGTFFAEWINNSFTTTQNLPSNTDFIGISYYNKVPPSKKYRDDPQYSLITAYFTGCIYIDIPKIQQNFKDVYETGKQLLFDQSSVNVKVLSPLAEQVTYGLKAIVKQASEPGNGLPGIWGNPFDMPVNKLLRLIFNDHIEIYIWLVAIPDGYIPYYFYADRSNPIFQNLPLGDNPDRLAHRTWWVYAEMNITNYEKRYNILYSFFNDSTLSRYLLNFRLPYGQKSLLSISEATKNALLKKEIKIQ